MRSLKFLIVALSAALPAAAQFAKFECQPNLSAFPSLTSVTGDCEGLTAEQGSATGAGFAVVRALPTCGFPVQGSKYAFLLAKPNIDRGFGAVVPRPLAPGTTELRIPIPAGSPLVRFWWGWNNEEGPSSIFNDGFDFSVCDLPPTDGIDGYGCGASHRRDCEKRRDERERRRDDKKT